jgi:hypothetical protein
MTSQDQFYRLKAEPSHRLVPGTNTIDLNYGDNFYDSHVNQMGFLKKLNSIDLDNLGIYQPLKFAFNTEERHSSSRIAACNLLKKKKHDVCHTQLVQGVSRDPKDNRCKEGDNEQQRMEKHNNIMECRNLRALELNSTCGFKDPDGNYHANNINDEVYRRHAEQIPLEEMAASECLYPTDNTEDRTNLDDIREARRALVPQRDFTASSMVDESGQAGVGIIDTNLFMRALLNASKTRIPTIQINAGSITGNLQRPVDLDDTGKLSEFYSNVQTLTAQQAAQAQADAQAEAQSNARRIAFLQSQIAIFEKSRLPINVAIRDAVTQAYLIFKKQYDTLNKKPKKTKADIKKLEEDHKRLEEIKKNFMEIFYKSFLVEIYNKLLSIKVIISQNSLRILLHVHPQDKRFKEYIKKLPRDLKEAIKDEIPKYSLDPTDFDFEPFYRKEYLKNPYLRRISVMSKHHSKYQLGPITFDTFDIDNLQEEIITYKTQLRDGMFGGHKKSRLRFKKGEFKSRKQRKLVKKSRTKR